MSPDSARATRQRRAWRVMSAAGCLLASASLLMSVVLFGRASDLSRDIQESRAHAIWSACTEQNERHDRTIRQLDELISGLPVGSRRRRAERSRTGTIALIGALAPRRDCDVLVRERVQP